MNLVVLITNEIICFVKIMYIEIKKTHEKGYKRKYGPNFCHDIDLNP